MQIKITALGYIRNSLVLFLKKKKNKNKQENDEEECGALVREK